MQGSQLIHGRYFVFQESNSLSDYLINATNPLCSFLREEIHREDNPSLQEASWTHYFLLLSDRSPYSFSHSFVRHEVSCKATKRLTSHLGLKLEQKLPSILQTSLFLIFGYSLFSVGQSLAQTSPSDLELLRHSQPQEVHLLASNVSFRLKPHISQFPWFPFSFSLVNFQPSELGTLKFVHTSLHVWWSACIYGSSWKI